MKIGKYKIRRSKVMKIVMIVFSGFVVLATLAGTMFPGGFTSAPK